MDVLENKVSICLWRYGKIADDRGYSFGAWKTIYDIQMFSKSICLCRLSEIGQEIGTAKDVKDFLVGKEFLKKNGIREQYLVNCCPNCSRRENVVDDYMSLTLCHIAFVREREKIAQIKEMIDILYCGYDITSENPCDDKRSADAELEKIKVLIKDYFPKELNLGVILTNKYDAVVWPGNMNDER